MKRGLRCLYESSSQNTNQMTNTPMGAEIATTRSLLHDQQVLPTTGPPGDSIATDLEGGSLCIAPRAGAIHSPATNNNMDPWQEESFNHALEQFDWVFPEPTVDPNPNELDIFAQPMEVLPGPENDNRGGTSQPPMTATGSSQPNLPLTGCRCRESLMHHAPILESAIQEKPRPQLDRMFKVTGDVIKTCENATRCGCHTRPVDLVCIVTVFQQTAACFDYIAKSGLDGTVKVGIGNYCITRTDNASFKRMLVLDLVTQADEVLDSLSALASNLDSALKEPGVKVINRSPACLNQLNLHYIREVVASFKKLFRVITECFNKQASGASSQHDQGIANTSG